MHNITLTNAAAALLANLTASTAPDRFREAVLVGEWAERHLSDLPDAPIQPGNDGQPQDWSDFNRASKSWARHYLTAMETTDAERDALRSVIRKAKDKIPAAPHAAVLLRAFGLAEE